MNRSQSAFTLIEVLMAAAMFAIVLAAINTVFYGALRLARKSTETSDRAFPRHQAVRIITDDLRYMTAPGGTFGGQLLVNEQGMAQSASSSPSIEFHTSSAIVTATQPWADVQKVAYYLRTPLALTNSAGLELVRAASRNLLPSIEDFPAEQVLLDQVESIAFAFYDGESWLEIWDTNSTEVTLKAVQFQIHFAPQPPDYQLRTPLELLVPITTQALTNQVSSSSEDNAPDDGGSNAGPQSGSPQSGSPPSGGPPAGSPQPGSPGGSPSGGRQ